MCTPDNYFILCVNFHSQLCHDVLNVLKSLPIKIESPWKNHNCMLVRP